MLRRCNKKLQNNYIRIINYHSVPEESRHQFEKQIVWFLNHFEGCDKEKLVRFLKGEYTFSSRPGIIFTFDDGFLDNYTVAYPVLKKHNTVGMFMVSPALIGKKNAGESCMDYMSEDQISDLCTNGNEICSHTSTHHRMNTEDTAEILIYEIEDSRKALEKILGHEVDVFCWCGGEDGTYTKEAAQMIRKYYRYGMMTNSFPIRPDTDVFQLDRSNIEASWSIALVKFQIAGFIDFKLKNKRQRVHELTKA